MKSQYHGGLFFLLPEFSIVSLSRKGVGADTQASATRPPKNVSSIPLPFVFPFQTPILLSIMNGTESVAKKESVYWQNST